MISKFFRVVSTVIFRETYSDDETCAVCGRPLDDCTCESGDSLIDIDDMPED